MSENKITYILNGTVTSDSIVWKLLFNDTTATKLLWVNLFGSIGVFFFFWIFLSQIADIIYHANALKFAAVIAVSYFVGGAIIMMSVSFLFRKIIFDTERLLTGELE